VFGPDSGVDNIFDFGFGAGRIDVSQWGFTDLADLTIVANGTASVEVRFDAANYVTVNQHAGLGLTLTVDDFVFAQPS